MVVPVRTIPPFKYADLLSHGPFGDFRDELATNGYVVIPVIPREKALEYRSRALSWLEGFGLGFDRNKPETFVPETMPVNHRGGMYTYGNYGFSHEQWVWDIRTEPGVIAVFEKLWGTDKLVTSFDGGSLMLPPPGREVGVAPEEAHWEHIDQNPSRVGFFLAQGLVNLNDNGQEDGGLQVMKGSSKLMKEFFDVHGRPPIPSQQIDNHMFSLDDKKWFTDRGAEWIKVDAQPGDLILWDSSCMHQNRPPYGNRDRMVTYVCMAPAELLSEEDKVQRERAWRTGTSTTHAPVHGAFCRDWPAHIRPETNLPCPVNDKRIQPVTPTEKVLKLAGQMPY